MYDYGHDLSAILFIYLEKLCNFSELTSPEISFKTSISTFIFGKILKDYRKIKQFGYKVS